MPSLILRVSATTKNKKEIKAMVPAARRRSMAKHHFVFAAATVALIVSVGSLWPVAARAEVYYGPLVRGNGQCWHTSFGVGSPAIGYWGDCQRDAPSLFRSERSLHSDTQKGKAPY
jgi:hypothetical protein